jgi:hypothetical protein
LDNIKKIFRFYKDIFAGYNLDLYDKRIYNEESDWCDRTILYLVEQILWSLKPVG